LENIRGTEFNAYIASLTEILIDLDKFNAFLVSLSWTQMHSTIVIKFFSGIQLCFRLPTLKTFLSMSRKVANLVGQFS